jgi:hypothetical protein
LVVYNAARRKVRQAAKQLKVEKRKLDDANAVGLSQVECSLTHSLKLPGFNP